MKEAMQLTKNYRVSELVIKLNNELINDTNENNKFKK